MIDLVILSSQRGTGSQPPIETLSGRGGGPVPLSMRVISPNRSSNGPPETTSWTIPLISKKKPGAINPISVCH